MTLGTDKDKLVLDTNVVIAYLAGQPAAKEAFSKREVHLSVVNEIELKCFPKLTPADIQIINIYLSRTILWSINGAIKEIAIEFRKTYRLGLADAIIAATASVLDMPLVTQDKDFTRLPTELVNVILYKP